MPCSTTAMLTMPALYGCWGSWLGCVRGHPCCVDAARVLRKAAAAHSYHEESAVAGDTPGMHASLCRVGAIGLKE